MGLVSISFKNYRATHPYEMDGADSSDSEDDDFKEKRHHKMDSKFFKEINFFQNFKCFLILKKLIIISSPSARIWSKWSYL